jgi:hypothetical protein
VATDLFSVCQFFEDDAYEYVRRDVGPEEAVRAFVAMATSVGAKIGTTKRVILTDRGDCTNLEWVFGQGVVFPAKGDPGWMDIP